MYFSFLKNVNFKSILPVCNFWFRNYVLPLHLIVAISDSSVFFNKVFYFLKAKRKLASVAFVENDKMQQEIMSNNHGTGIGSVCKNEKKVKQQN